LRELPHYPILPAEKRHAGSMSAMNHHQQFYIDGAWVDPVVPATLDVIDPSTEEAYTRISVGTKADVDRAVAAAKAAFPKFSQTTKAERLKLLKRILEVYNERYEDIAQAVSHEMGAPITWAREAQAWAGRAHMESTIKALEDYEFEEKRGGTMVVKEPIGVCALITPWNWPLNQIVCKVAPAIAAGCTVVLKPSEIAPISGIIFSEVMEAAGTPKGVYNMVNGTGPDVGQIMAGHPDVDMVSFTGSTRAGIIVAKTAAETVKRVSQELGGKSANIILPDADFAHAVKKGVEGCFGNSGQSCDAPTRMLVPASRHDEALAIAKDAAEKFKVGDPRSEDTQLGPVVSQIQFDKIQGLIESGIAEGATVVTGGNGRPGHLNRGYYVRPTVFGHVRPGMRIEKEEIFGPVLSVISYEDEDDAVKIANDTVYGLAAYVQSQDIDHARKVAGQLRAGQVSINYPDWDTFAPFGGYKQSGNGREYADWAIHDFLETKGIIGYGD
jgi:aldehyde dehydrogenase (NAD+)